MIRTALLLEIEELLFDTRSVRTAALCESLQQEGATIDRRVVESAHAGVPAVVAVERLSAALTLDAIGRDLAIHRAAEYASSVFAAHPPSFDAESRDALEALSTDFPIGVVTRGSGVEAQQWLAGAGLEACVLTIRSLAGQDPSDFVATWADALRRTHASRGVAVAAPALLQSARRAGLHAFVVGDHPESTDSGYHPDARLESLSQVHAALLSAS